MAQTPPPTINPVPTPPIQRGDRATFSSRVDAFITWLVTAVTQFGLVATNVYNNAVDAFNSAVAAAASAATALGSANTAVSAVNNAKWVAVTNYADGAAVWSPIDRRTYRRVGAGTSATDPSLDLVNWTLISQEPGYRLIGEANILAGSPVASVNFLSILIDDYSSIRVELEGIVPNPTSDIALRVAVGGVVISGASDYAVSNGQAASQILLTQSLQVNSDVSGGFSASIDLNNLRAATRKKVSWSAALYSGASVNRGFNDTQLVVNAGAVSGIQIFPTAGGANLVRGRIRVYALRTK